VIYLWVDFKWGVRFAYARARFRARLAAQRRELARRLAYLEARRQPQVSSIETNLTFPIEKARAIELARRAQVKAKRLAAIREWLAAGETLSGREIARRLGISPTTGSRYLRQAAN